MTKPKTCERIQANRWIPDMLQENKQNTGKHLIARVRWLGVVGSLATFRAHVPVATEYRG